MKRYLTVMGGMAALFLVLFLLVGALRIPLLSDPSLWMERGGVAAALVGVGLLVADVVLPVPSSLIMIAHGALFGVIAGSSLSLLGSAGAAIVAFTLGRRGGALLDRLVPRDERERADRLLKKYGALAIIITRPVPILAETVAIMAGASPLGWGRMLAASLAGSLPASALYALTGAVAASFQNGALMFGLVLIIAGVFWLVGRYVEPLLGSESRAR
ncbi:MAG TPA: VTT domain-containing protein [Blastocatellia bacterium]|nr:VTT domain-containing protein [Blastocatellia bacterium]